MAFKLIQDLMQRQHGLPSILHASLLRNTCRCFSSTGETPRGSFSQDDPKAIDQNKLGTKSAVSMSNQDRLGHLMQLYEDVVGLTEVKLAQEKVVNAEQKFLQVQDDRRAMQQDLLSVQADVRAIGAELEKTSRTDSRYIDLVKKEHEALLIEKEMANKVKALDKAERDFFALLSTALRESHEKERARAEKTKYWSIIGSVIGAIIGIIGSTFNNYKRMKELRAIVSESGENTAEYKALANKMVEAVFSQQSKIEEFVDSVKNLDNVSGMDKVKITEPLFVNHRDFNHHTEMILGAVEDQTKSLLKQLSDIQHQFSVDKANNSDRHVVYVGPDIDQIFRRTEQNIEAELRRSRWVTVAAFGGLVTVSVLAFVFRGSTGL